MYRAKQAGKRPASSWPAWWATAGPPDCRFNDRRDRVKCSVLLPSPTPLPLRRLHSRPTDGSRTASGQLPSLPAPGRLMPAIMLTALALGLALDGSNRHVFLRINAASSDCLPPALWSSDHLSGSVLGMIRTARPNPQDPAPLAGLLPSWRRHWPCSSVRAASATST
jgi:hypothetical protein